MATHPTTAIIGTSPTTRCREHRNNAANTADDDSVLIGLGSRSSTLDNEEIISPPLEEPAQTSAWRSRFCENDLDSFESGITVVEKEKSIQSPQGQTGWFYSTIDKTRIQPRMTSKKQP